MKKLLLVFILFVGFTNIHASDTLNTHTYIRIDDSFEVKGHAYDSIGNYNYIHKRFRIGVSVCFFSFDKWYSTDSLIMLNQNTAKKNAITLSPLTPFSILLGFKIHNNIYFQIGGVLTRQYIEKLSDREPDPKGNNPVKEAYSYERRNLQIPFSFSFSTDRKNSTYFNIGIKTNFIYYERLEGENNPVFTFNPASSTHYDVTYQRIDISDKKFKYTGLVPYFNLGAISWFKRRRLGIAYFISMDLQQQYFKYNTISDFPFAETSFTNIQLVYNF